MISFSFYFMTIFDCKLNGPKLYFRNIFLSIFAPSCLLQLVKSILMRDYYFFVLETLSFCYFLVNFAGNVKSLKHNLSALNQEKVSLAHIWPEWKMSAYDENLINQSFNTASLLACMHATFLAYPLYRREKKSNMYD